MKFIRIISFSLLFFISQWSFSQEIFASVQVNARQIQGTENRVFENLQNALFEFINNRVWTNYNFRIEERIEFTMVITVNERVSTNEFKGQINLVLQRPIYGTSYNSPLINWVDKDFQFEYSEFMPLEYNDNTFTNNLTSVVAFYVYLCLGLDFDTFSLYGGTPFYEKAQTVVNNSQNAAETGWKAFEDDRNRYWLIENYLNNNYKPIRQFLYEYHRKGLDIMSENKEKGRAHITQQFSLLQEAYDRRPGLFMLQLLMDAKKDEFINLYSEADPREKSEVVNVLKEIDPANSSSYQKILSGN